MHAYDDLIGSSSLKGIADLLIYHDRATKVMSLVNPTGQIDMLTIDARLMNNCLVFLTQRLFINDKLSDKYIKIVIILPYLRIP